MNSQNFFSASIQSNNELYAQVDLKTKRNNRASAESSAGLIDSTILTEVNLNQVLKFEKVNFTLRFSLHDYKVKTP